MKLIAPAIQRPSLRTMTSRMSSGMVSPTSRKELAGEVGRAPLAPARVQVETVEVVPVLFGDVTAGEPDDLQPGLVHRLAFFPDVLALA
jgi:hypothetical protein